MLFAGFHQHTGKDSFHTLWSGPPTWHLWAMWFHKRQLLRSVFQEGLVLVLLWTCKSVSLSQRHFYLLLSYIIWHSSSMNQGHLCCDETPRAKYQWHRTSDVYVVQNGCHNFGSVSGSLYPLWPFGSYVESWTFMNQRKMARAIYFSDYLLIPGLRRAMISIQRKWWSDQEIVSSMFIPGANIRSCMWPLCVVPMTT